MKLCLLCRHLCAGIPIKFALQTIMGDHKFGPRVGFICYDCVEALKADPPKVFIEHKEDLIQD